MWPNMHGNKQKYMDTGEHWALGLGHIVPIKGKTNLNLARILRATPETALRAPQQTASGIIDKAKEKGTSSLTKSGVAGSPYHEDFKKGLELLKDPDLWKIPTKQEGADMKERVAALKRSYHTLQNLGFKG